MGGGEILRGYLTEGSSARRLAYYTAESAVFTGLAAGSVMTLTIQARQGWHVLVTGLTVLRTLNPSNVTTPNVTADWPGDLELTLLSNSKSVNKGILKSGTIGGFANQGFTWADYIYLKPLEGLELTITTTNTNEQRFTAIYTCEEFLPK